MLLQNNIFSTCVLRSHCWKDLCSTMWIVHMDQMTDHLEVITAFLRSALQDPDHGCYPWIVSGWILWSIIGLWNLYILDLDKQFRYLFAVHFS